MQLCISLRSPFEALFILFLHIIGLEIIIPNKYKKETSACHPIVLLRNHMANNDKTTMS